MAGPRAAPAASGGEAGGARGRLGLGEVRAAVTAFTAIAALLFTGLSLQQTRVQNQLAESGQITDRFNAAVTNLGSGTETIRIGGIYALQRIMQDSPRDQPAAIQVLAAFVRQQAPLQAIAAASVALPTLSGPAIDVQTALTVLGTRDPSHDQNAPIDLSDTNLYKAQLDNANFVDANLNNTYLEGAHLEGARLSGANLDIANLYCADLTGANLSHPDLSGANLTDADPDGEHLTVDEGPYAQFFGPDLPDADFNGANLSGVDLTTLGLTGVDLNNAKLTDARLDSASWCHGAKPLKPEGYICSPD